ncbi:MAG: LamG domain-containing protein [bacterium]
MMGRLFTVFILVLAIVPTHANDAAADDRIVLPGTGLFDADEGTVECWVKFAFEPLADHGAHRGWGTLFHFDFGDPAFPGDGLRISLHSVEVGRRSRTGQQLRLRAIISSGGVAVMHPTVSGFGQDVTRNQWYHVAVTWSAEQRALHVYINGERKSVRTFHSHRNYQPTLTGQARLSLGSSLTQPAQPHLFAIDQLRISATARSAEQLGYHEGPLAPDAQTLLLMTFDEASPDSQVIPITYAAPTALGDTELARPTFARLIEGCFGGHALAFTQEAFGAP